MNKTRLFLALCLFTLVTFSVSSWAADAGKEEMDEYEQKIRNTF